MDPLNTVLRKLARRLGLQQWVGYLAVALCGTSSFALLWVVISRLFPVVGDPLYAAAGLVGVGILVATIAGIVNRPTLLRAALEADRQLDLKERLTTSLELEDASGPMVEALHADARRRIEEASLQGKFRMLATPAMRWAFAPLVALGLAYVFLPEFDLLKYEEKVAEAKERDEEIAVRVERLKAAVQPLEDGAEEAEVLAEMTAEVEQVAEGLKTGAITEKQALAKLANIAQELQKHRDGLEQGRPKPKTLDDKEELGMASDLAAAIQEGRMDAAKKEMEKLKKKLEDGDLSAEEKKELAENLDSLAKKLGQQDSALSEALANSMAAAAEAMQSGDSEAMEAAMEAFELSAEDIESIQRQLEQLDSAMASLSEWQQDLLGPSEYCRVCGSKLAECENPGSGECENHGAGHECSGVCESHGNGKGNGNGPGMGGAGRGQGNSVGELPDLPVGFQPTQAGGPVTQGRMLADILQKAAPEPGAQPKSEFISGEFVKVKQAAERALTQEEIPQGSKEYVRQYFGSLDPEKPQGETP